MRKSWPVDPLSDYEPRLHIAEERTNRFPALFEDAPFGHESFLAKLFTWIVLTEYRVNAGHLAAECAEAVEVALRPVRYPLNRRAVYLVVFQAARSLPC